MSKHPSDTGVDYVETIQDFCCNKSADVSPDDTRVATTPKVVSLYLSFEDASIYKFQITQIPRFSGEKARCKEAML